MEALRIERLCGESREEMQRIREG